MSITARPLFTPVAELIPRQVGGGEIWGFIEGNAGKRAELSLTTTTYRLLITD
jgi:hypothetical protein